MVEADAIRTLASALLERYQFARQNGLSFGGKRDMYEVLGYPTVISGKDYRLRYQRGGLAHRIVEIYPKSTWRGGLEIYDDEDPKHVTEFEQTIIDLNTKLKLWSVLRRLDILAGMSSYGVMLIGAPGDPSQELPKGKPGQVLYLTLFSGGGGPGSPTVGNAGEQSDATIAELVTDAKDPRYGLPLNYNLTRLASTPGYSKPVHWTRILHVAEGCLDNDVYGSPVLEPVWNYLDDLDKCVGGGAEAFWLRVNKGLVLSADKDTALTPEEKASLATQAEEYQHQLRRILQTRKVDVKDLGSDVANFANQLDSIITLIAGTLGVPKRILTGSEMGELASSQDRENWRDQVSGRRTEYAEPSIVRPFIDRLVSYGYLPKPKNDRYEVDWSTITTLTMTERTQGASAWASTNQTQGAPVYTVDEIRDTWNDLPPLTPEQIAAATPAPPEPSVPEVPEEEEDPETEELPDEEGKEDDEEDDEEDDDEVDPKTGKPVKKPVKKPRMARAYNEYEEAILHALETAIEKNDTETIDEILGIKHD